jgi:endoglucanase
LITYVRRRRSAVLAGTLLVAVASGCDTQADRSRPPAAPAANKDRPAGHATAVPVPRGGNPLAGHDFYVDPATPAAVQVTRWTAEGRAGEAKEIRKIADRPTAQWLSGGGSPVTGRVDATLHQAEREDRMPVLVAYHIPHRDCGSFSSGGAASADAYRSWIRDFAAGIKGRPVTVILEPDAVAHTLDGCVTDVEERYVLLRDAVSVLKATGSARVYVDAGHPLWIRDVGKIAGALRRAGISRADGFSLNVSNFVRTADNVRYGRQVSDALGGRTRFVVDTSRNGAGPFPGGGQVGGGPSWCNPPGRVLGEAPTADTGMARVDALLWIKRPGESDGACRPGEPQAGQWWPEYALDLARRSD